MFPNLRFAVGDDASAKRRTAWKRIVQTPELSTAKIASLAATDQVFAIGSCFANEIRAVLERAGVAVHPLIDPDLARLFPEETKTPPRWGPWDERVHYQCFTPMTIRQEIEIALGTWRPDPEAIFERRIKGRTVFIDPYRRGVYARTREELLEIRARMNQAVQRGVAEASLIVMTLGLVEAFRLVQHGGYLSEYNNHLGDEHLEFINAGYDEALAALTGAVDLVRAAYPEKPIVVTVSPIPISRTFMDSDAITATTRGKSILRTCAETLVQNYRHVHYWPSYEYAMWSGDAFGADRRHVTPAAVQEITSAFCRAFFCDQVGQQAALTVSGSPERRASLWGRLRRAS